VLAIHQAFSAGSSLDQAIARVFADVPCPPESDGAIRIDWNAAIEAFRSAKLSSGAIKEATWTTVYQRRMALVLKAVSSKKPPNNGKQLLEAIADPWKATPGCRGRQIQVQQTAALLRWAVDAERLPPDWAPPLDLLPYVGRKRKAKAVTTPIEVEHILSLVEGIPDPRWRFAFQLLAAFGLRPEELQHLEKRGGQLWSTYEKVTPRGRTAPRQLRLLPCDDWAEDWQLVDRFHADRLPPMRPGYGAEDLGQYMRRRREWEALRRSYEESGEKLVLYSCRHGYAHRAHIVCDLAPKVAAAAMGHSVETHLAAYSRWCSEATVDDAFEKARARLQG
jgi:integrase